MKKNRAKGEMVRSLGRKDNHSKICTSKGARDRRIRLSANTAIQFYDVQDRLGFDRPSNAIDWLMKEAKAAIDVLNADHYHHLHELLLPDTTSIFNHSEAFHRTPGDRNQQNLNHDQTNSFNNYPFEIIDSRNRSIPIPQDINFPPSTIPPHFVWNPNYKAGEGFEFVNGEPLQSNFHPPIVHTLNNEFTNDDDGLLGFSFEQDIQVQEEDLQDKEDDLNHEHLSARKVQGYLI